LLADEPGSLIIPAIASHARDALARQRRWAL